MLGPDAAAMWSTWRAMSVRWGPTSSWWKQTPTTPPESRTASSCASVRLRADGHERMGTRVGDDERLLGDRGDVPESALVEVGEVDEDPELVAGPHERAAGSGEPGADVRRGGRGERHAVAERVRPAPRDPERAQPARVQRGQVLEAGLDRLGALDVHDRPDRPGELEVAALAHDAQRPLGLEREQLVDPGVRRRERQIVRDRRLGLNVGAALGVEREAVGVRREDREEAAREPAGASALEVEVALVRALAERSLLEQHVVVSVEDRRCHRDTVTRCSTSPVRSAARWRSSASAGRS